MSMTLLIGLGMVVIAAAAIVPIIFSGENEPATVPVRSERTPERAPQAPQRRPAPSRSGEHRPVTIRVPETVSIHPAWWERLRGLAGLIVVTVGLGMAVAVAVGLVVMVVGLTLLS